MTQSAGSVPETHAAVALVADRFLTVAARLRGCAFLGQISDSGIYLVLWHGTWQYQHRAAVLGEADNHLY